MLSVKDIHKTFGTNRVLKGISMELDRGEVLALIGGNGAGKSTLMKIIMGIYHADAGDIYINGQKTDISSTSVALKSGVYMVPQEPLLFPNMTVEENILIGFQEKASELKKKLSTYLKELDFTLNLQRKANTLSIAEQQLVEILKGMMREASILILDEPTSALTFGEVQSLFRVINDLRNKGIAIIYITHRLSEVFEIATHVAIMRDGAVTVSGSVSEFNKDILVRALLPPETSLREDRERPYNPVAYDKEKPVLQVKNLSGYGFSDISFDLFPGEILGVAGVVGAGRTELAHTIFGRDSVLHGSVFLDGKDITGFSTRKVLKEGINYVPEDRHYHGIFSISAIYANTTSALLPTKEIGNVFLNRKKEDAISQKYASDFRTKIVALTDLIGSLSGGNQQKVVIARALSTAPKVVILDEPTRGIDAGARGDVYHIIHQLKQEGVAVLLISSDMEEIVELADRAITVYNGRINNSFLRDEITQDALTSAAFGINAKEEKGGDA
ncbi:MAG: sugar ABC transporter ATP-binding protein [Lachnospiraceae bacterium]|nr:sugar ABC transporter ATP-binding protein [Lachnospiraceae bacterium]